MQPTSSTPDCAEMQPVSSAEESSESIVGIISAASRLHLSLDFQSHHRSLSYLPSAHIRITLITLRVCTLPCWPTFVSPYYEYSAANDRASLTAQPLENSLRLLRFPYHQKHNSP